ncbi:hypothetical protein ScPMuIL_014396 [Solemya velum]
MPCWYFDKKEIKSSSSYHDGIDTQTECRYRREGARLIIDAGTKLGLRYDTCATGVAYFHRFYMFHSFREFHRYVTSACSLFLAGKVEETPKKCKDIIKIYQSMLNPHQFSMFGEDPREEVMTMERILLQTIKFDLQVDHPYSLLLKYAKIVKGDKEKINKLVQMAWTFINDSLCTTLCLQWEPEIIAVSLMYLGTRLTKCDIHDWHGKLPGTKMKWWEFFLNDLTVELMEDICHQVLDLYSGKQKSLMEESPPLTPPKHPPHKPTPTALVSHGKRSKSGTPVDIGPDAKIIKLDPNLAKIAKNSSGHGTPVKSIEAIDTRSSTYSKAAAKGGGDPETTSERLPEVHHQPAQVPPQQGAYPPVPVGQNPQGPPPMGGEYPTGDGLNQYNPYMSSQMYTSSFMSGEGSQNIQSILNQNQPPSQYPPGYNPPPASQYPPTTQYPGYQPASHPSGNVPTSGYPGQNPPSHHGYQVHPQAGYPQSTTTANPYGPPQGYSQSQYPPPGGAGQHPYRGQYQPPAAFEGQQPRPRAPFPKKGSKQNTQGGSGLAMVRITGRR